MKISTGSVQSPLGGTSPVAAPAAVESVASATERARPGAGENALQSAVLQPALAALREMPDIDHAKVAALRDAFARGDVPFDAGKLAGLIERFHRNKP